ncbi:pilus assembly protein TadG-related protein [Georgenia sp. M64]|uniref:pilus assembly protein TadG-related protein n=1 Tax=Georgenia sp. M64 TaxID=3120520 RepID=UPI0030E4547F
MQRLKDERGAIAVLVALLMVVLVGFAAVSIDIAAINAERRELQLAADASALAIAQDCARGDCKTPSTTAATFTAANVDDADAAATSTPVTPTTGTVTVDTTGTAEHWFAPVLGIDETNVQASATASWGYPTGGIPILPLALNECEFDHQVQSQGGLADAPEPLTILRSKDLKENDLPDDWPCEMPQSGNHVPGGFGWLETVPGTCDAITKAGEDIASDPGNSISTGCDWADLVDARDKVVLLPLFDNSGGEGNNGWFTISGYAAFHIKGYDFTGNGGEQWGLTCPQSVNTCIRGYFEEYVDSTAAFDYGTDPDYDFGSEVVSLTD